MPRTPQHPTQNQNVVNVGLRVGKTSLSTITTLFPTFTLPQITHLQALTSKSQNKKRIVGATNKTPMQVMGFTNTSYGKHQHNPLVYGSISYYTLFIINYLIIKPLPHPHSSSIVLQAALILPQTLGVPFTTQKAAENKPSPPDADNAAAGKSRPEPFVALGDGHL